MCGDTALGRPLIAGVVDESAAGAALQAQRLVLAPAGRRAITQGGGVRPNGDIELAIPPEKRPFSEEPAVLDYYDGPLLMVLASPLWGDLLALALPDEAGPWPFLLAPATPDQVAAVTQHLRDIWTDVTPAKGRGMRTHFLEAEKVYLLRDYGAQDLVASPVNHPLPEDWLPNPGY